MPRWMLQPHNYSQIQHRNLYDVAYRRTGAYKGMGVLGQDAESISAAAGGAPVNPVYSASGGIPSSMPSTTVNWLPWAIGGGLLLVLLLAGRR